MLVTHIYYNGQCKKAIEMYREAFGATIKTMIEDSNTQLIVHAELIIHNELLMMNDFGNNDGFSKSGGYQLSVQFDHKADLKKAYSVLQSDCTIVVNLCRLQTIALALLDLLINLMLDGHSGFNGSYS